MLSMLESEGPWPAVPAAFFLHFSPEFHRGHAAVDQHVVYFQHTDMDWVKIQYERPFPRRPEIRAPADWAKMPLYGRDFYEEPLYVVEDVVRMMRREALVVITLYSPFMSAGHTAGDAAITAHLQEDPEAVRVGLEAITESTLIFCRECIKRGVDGFYHSTQGREAGRFPDKSIFDRYVRPYDLAVMKELDRACAFNILHVCDYCGPYDDLTPFADYPGRIVNAPLHLAEGRASPGEVAELFRRPYMGGLDRHGVLVTGTDAEVEAEVQALLDEAPPRFILGADCTLPSDTPWDRVRLAIDLAHGAREGMASLSGA
jgi:uroporphyrinogen decarboxylase